MKNLDNFKDGVVPVKIVGYVVLFLQRGENYWQIGLGFNRPNSIAEIRIDRHDRIMNNYKVPNHTCSLHTSIQSCLSLRITQLSTEIIICNVYERDNSYFLKEFKKLSNPIEISTYCKLLREQHENSSKL